MGKPKDSFERVNYLYQAANLVFHSPLRNAALAQFYADTLCNISKRGVLKLDPSIKKTLCKRCHALLIPGSTSTVRFRSRRQPHLVVTCLRCKTLKRFVCDDKYKLWCEQPEAVMEPGSAKSRPRIQSGEQTVRASVREKNVTPAPPTEVPEKGEEKPVECTDKK